jgi:hypothetical protein
VRTALVAVSVLFLVTHAACLPSTFADLDAINFALGVRDFDVAQHQPHPPGYPLFIAVAKVSTAVAAGLGIPDASVRGLAVVSALSGALLILLIFQLARAILADEHLAGWTALVVGLSPLFWFNAARPLSDLAGLAIVVAAQALLMGVIFGRDPGRAAPLLLAGAGVTAVAIGVRSQSFVLTLPLLFMALVMPGTGIRMREKAAALLAALAGGLLWAVPLLIVSGGPEAYVLALSDQAGEDFGGVVMLWTMRTARVAIDAVQYSFLWPWGTLVAGWIVVAVAAVGAARMLYIRPLAFLALAVAFAPYAIFHLLFQETLTTRYAMPLVVPVGLLAVYAAAGAGRMAVAVGGTALVAWSLSVAAPAAVDYGTRTTPAAAAVRDALGSDPVIPIGMHAVMLRSEQWSHGNASGRMIRERHGYEIDALIGRWRRDPDTTMMFIADPRRSDLARIDPRARTLERAYGWGFDAWPLLGGVRPGEVQLFRLAPPGWMLEAGWAVTPEVGGQTERAGAGPHRRPAVAWIRSRDGAATLLIGGRNLGPGSEDALITVRIDGRDVASWPAAPGFFVETRELPAGTLQGTRPYQRLEVTAAGAAEGEVAVGLEQFDLQSPGVPMVGYGHGWQEPEYEPVSGRTWRWMSDRARLFVRNVGRDVTLTLAGESPLRYYDDAPNVRVSVGGTVLAEFSPADDFSRQVAIPSRLLEDGRAEVLIESDRSFVPGGGDQRNLALRIYTVSVD